MDFSEPVQSSLIEISYLIVGVMFYLLFICLATRYFLVLYLLKKISIHQTAKPVY